MPKLIVGLGNPGDEYAKTRHNTGFMMLDTLAINKALSWQDKPKFHAQTTEYNAGGEKVILAKPQTYYNDSGLAVRTIADFYKIPPENILIIHDELALPFGTIRTREKGSDAGNNGIKSITQHIGPDFARIRIGIWNALRDRVSDKDYVLSRFSKTETEKLPAISDEIMKIIEEFINNKIITTTWRI